MHTYPDIYRAAHGQKLSFSDFISDWLMEHDISGDNQREPIIYAIVQTKNARWYTCTLESHVK